MRLPMTFFALACMNLLLGGCSSRAEELVVEAPPAEVSTGGAEHAELEIPRFQLHRVIEGGLGRVLQRLELEPYRVEGGFRGFRVLRSRLYTRSGEPIDLRPGDVILALNGRSIERPEEAMQAFEALRGEEAIVVSILRDENRDELRIPIVD